MKFNIKNWQDKHLIIESKLRELDFKTPAEFKAYKAKHKVGDHTKVNIAGKETTAGEESGKDTPPATKGSVDGKSLSDLVNTSLDNFDGEDYEEEAMENLDSLLKDTGLYDKDAVTYEDALKAVNDLDNSSDDRYNDADEAYDAKMEMQHQLIDLFDPEDTGELDPHDREELSRTTKGPMHGRFDDDDDDDYDDDDEDEEGNEPVKVATDASVKREEITSFVRKNRPAVRSYVNGVVSDNMSPSEAAVKYLGYSKEEVEDADFDPYGTIYDDVVSRLITDPEELEEFISGKDKDGDLQAGMDQIKKEYEDDPNVWESVNPRSTRIQEARMYKIIQELKGLEKVI